jgi:hypothetical protein
MKKCPFCAEEIQDDAIKCKHCREFLRAASPPHIEDNSLAWYFRTPFIIFAVCSVGPLALPLIWLRPGTSRPWKVGLTVVILVLSWILFQLTMVSIRSLSEYYHLLNTM